MTRSPVEPRRSLDCRGLLCPLPALETRRALADLEPGDCLEVLCTDPASVIDLRALCEESGDEIVTVEKRRDELRFRIVRGER